MLVLLKFPGCNNQREKCLKRFGEGDNNGTKVGKQLWGRAGGVQRYNRKRDHPYWGGVVEELENGRARQWAAVRDFPSEK